MKNNKPEGAKLIAFGFMFLHRKSVGGRLSLHPLLPSGRSPAQKRDLSGGSKRMRALPARRQQEEADTARLAEQRVVVKIA